MKKLKIALKIKNYHKYTLAPLSIQSFMTTMRKSPEKYFTLQEDQKIIQLAREENYSFEQISKLLEQKYGITATSQQIQHRWFSFLKPALNIDSPWSKSQFSNLLDKLLVFGLQFSTISKYSRIRRRKSIKSKTEQLLHQSIQFIISSVQGQKNIDAQSIKSLVYCLLSNGHSQYHKSILETTRKCLIYLQKKFLTPQLEIQKKQVTAIYNLLKKVQQQSKFVVEPIKAQSSAIKPFYWTKQEQHRIIQLVCQNKLGFGFIAKQLDKQFPNNQKYFSYDNIRIKTFGLLRDGFKKFNQLLLVYSQGKHSIEKLVNRSTAQRLFSIKSTNALLIRNRLLLLNFDGSICSQQVDQIYSFLLKFSFNENLQLKIENFNQFNLHK